ncbi:MULTISPECIES: OmpA/MotB family protein [unclassified Modestobacter]|uniref:OmpA/MotB family protein n=1 Tax=unclassified Modestobacter TaxID=2643866 RepID=UPI0022AB2B46|nr:MULTISPECIES: flagellar motor protein MotB [unclassified Modestobacter]MCZ2825117.1 flagellar motor protein MotB [Modestobacter sp. VKM Ac-2981]MCZ2853818.1 flagellar motor protein MotB [Modestobacter sp. VKM Ac-2982]
MSKSGGHGGHGGRRAKKHEEHEEHENHERWLVSGFDMMTLLFVLFVVLYAMSSIDLAKFTAFANGARQGAGAPVTILNDGAAIAAPVENDSPLKPVQVAQEAAIDGTAQTEAEQAAAVAAAEAEARAVAAEAESAYDQLAAARAAIAAALAAAGQTGAAQFIIDERGLVVRVVSDPVLFAPESAALMPQGVTVLNAMGPTIEDLPNLVRVEGHANSLPVTRGGPWPSNWELSAVRATTVLRHLVDANGVGQGRMSAVGYSDTRPLVPDTDPSYVTVNRRVDVVLLTMASPEANALLPGLEAATQTTDTTQATGTTSEGSQE